MIEAWLSGVGHDEVGLAGDRRDDAGVGGEARLEGQDGLVPLKAASSASSASCIVIVPGDRPHGPASRRRTRGPPSSAASRSRGWWVRPR